MKKIILTFAFIFITFIGINAQNEESKSSNYTATIDTKPHEIKFNALYLLLGNIELTYEHIFNENSSFGIMGNVNVDNNVFLNMNYMFLPYFRLYSGDNGNGGFFEGGFAFYNQKTNNSFNNSQVNQNSFGPSLSFGSKTVYKNNVTLECLFGVCRNFSSSVGETPLLFPRFGITLGKRF